MKPFRMSIRLPVGQDDLRVRLALALIETAADRVLAGLARRFEDSLVHAPPEDVADLLLWHHDVLEEARERVVAQAYQWLRDGWVEPDDAAARALVAVSEFSVH